MNPIIVALSLCVVSTAAHQFNTVTPEIPNPLQRLLNSAKSTSTGVRQAINPYKFTLQTANQASKSSSSPPHLLENKIAPTPIKSNANIAKILAKPGSQPGAATISNDKNWLLTKAWLIDNINRLRRELGELERDYTQHLNTIEQNNSIKEKAFVEDIAKLRADHTVLSQQQKQIIYLIKKNQLFKQRTSLSENDIKYRLMKKVPDAPKTRRPIKRDVSAIQTESFESETRRNMKETFAQLSSLHDITISIFDDLRYLQRKMNNKLPAK